MMDDKTSGPHFRSPLVVVSLCAFVRMVAIDENEINLIIMFEGAGVSDDQLNALQQIRLS